jgi:3-methyl-2-oxobutanoate hydroxymethyltransferase
MGHLGLTPQSVHQLGGYRVQGRDGPAAEKLRAQAMRVEAAGCFGLVLECVPVAVAEAISRELEIATIGIGAGPGTDGQVLVFHDLLGLSGNVDPKFVRKFLAGGPLIADALKRFDYEVKSGGFPSTEESYH